MPPLRSSAQSSTCSLLPLTAPASPGAQGLPLFLAHIWVICIGHLPQLNHALQTFAACSAAQNVLLLCFAMCKTIQENDVCCRNEQGQLSAWVPCKSTLVAGADASIVGHLAEGPYFVFHLKHHTQNMSKKRQQM